MMMKVRKGVGWEQGLDAGRRGDEVEIVQRQSKNRAYQKRKISVLIVSLPPSHFRLALCRKSLKSKPIKLCQIYRISQI